MAELQCGTERVSKSEINGGSCVILWTRGGDFRICGRDWSLGSAPV